MRRPAQFPAALAASFAIMLAAYSTLAACGYWYWVRLGRLGVLPGAGAG